MGVLKRLVISLLLASALVSAPQRPSSTPSQDTANESWQKEFDDICSKTQDAMTFSVEELKALLQRCDALAPRLEKLDETRKKVYQRRLKQCRGLFAYVLESKQESQRKEKP